MKREEVGFAVSVLYLRRVSASNGFDAHGRTRTCPAEYVCTRVRGAIPHARARTCSPAMHTRAHGSREGRTRGLVVRRGRTHERARA